MGANILYYTHYRAYLQRLYTSISWPSLIS